MAAPAFRAAPVERNLVKESAHQLGLAPATVRHHLRSAYVKLGVSDKAAFATRLGAA